MSGCYGCCPALKPRYMRLVDSIFPANPQEGIVKTNLDKLTFFAMKSPEKLDRIGEYLAQRLSRDVTRQRYGYVRISMEALDTLLVTCHAQSLNLFVESYLKMVQKLVECNEPDMQCLAAASFVKFANIEEDTPSYHRRYDFFVSKFSSMCHNNNDSLETQNKIRCAGLRGVHGVVRKTVSDDLQVNIWEHTHMDKIVPSLLYNMQNASGSAEAESPKDEDDPTLVAEGVFRDLVCRASFGNINSVIKPVLMHLDNHNLWVPNDFAVKCFKIIMYSVQAQYGYVVVQMLMAHLDMHTKKEPKVKASIVEVLSETVLIAAGGSIGPSVLEVFNTLLRHLRVSVDTDVKGDPRRANDEKHFQEAVINTIGEFANNLPDYQKIEILMFVMGKVPMPSDEHGAGDSKDVLLQTMLMKTILKVATKYKTVLMVNAFPTAFLEPLLRMSLVEDPGIRRIVQEILHTIIDRHDNSSKLKVVTIPKDIAQLDLTVEKAPRQDVMFMKKNGSLFYWHIYENVQKENNRVDNYEALYCTLALLLIEMGGDDVLIDLFRLVLGIQVLLSDQMVLGGKLCITHKCAIHAVMAAFLNLMSQLTAIPALCQHITQVIETRRKEAKCYLPEMAFNRNNEASSYPVSDEMHASWLFDMHAISEALQSSGHDISRLGTPYVPKPVGPLQLDTVDRSQSVSDIQSISIDMESTTSTPTLGQRRFPQEEVTFDSLKRALENTPQDKQEEEERQRLILDTFRNAPFEDLVARSDAKANQFQSKLNEIFDLIKKPQESPSGTPLKSHVDEEATPVFEIKYPRLFVY